jgi:hypothetical protein
MVWFGCMSDILQLASRVGGEWECGKFSPYHKTARLRERAGRGVAFPPLDRATLEGQSTAASGPADISSVSPAVRRLQL